MKKETKYISRDDAVSKLQAYCAYQERCHYEVRSKLISYKIYGDDLEEIITELINDNFLNEERYARAYARGKFRMKKWGKNKITQELKRRKVSAYCIKKGLTEIDPEAYYDTAFKLIKKYFESQAGIIPIKKQKTFAHAYRKGYESFIITEVLNDIIGTTR